MTRFGEISPVCRNFKSLWAIFGMVYLVYGKHLYQLLHFFAIDQIFNVVNGHRLKNEIAIWSHW